MWLKNNFWLILFQICFRLLVIHLYLLSGPSLTRGIDLFVASSQDTIRRNAASIQPDSLSPKNIRVPLKNARTDSAFTRNWTLPWHISDNMMNDFFYLDMGQVLQRVPGIVVKQLGFSGQEMTASYHGTGPGQTVLFLDGRPMYDPLYGSLDLNLVPIHFARSINIEPPTLANGNVPEGEAIFIVSALYEENQPYSRINYHKTPSGFSDLDITFGQQLTRNANLLLGGKLSSFDRTKVSRSFEQQHFRGKIQYHYSQDWSFEYLWLHNQIDRHTPYPSLGDKGSSNSYMIEKNSHLDHTVTIKGKLFRLQQVNFNASIFYTSFNGKFQDDEHQIRYLNPCGYAGLKVQIDQPLLGQHITTGSTFTHQWTHADPVGKHQYGFGSVFLQNRWHGQKNITFQGSLTFRRHQVLGSNWEGGVNGYCLVFNHFKLMATASRSIRYPSFFELYARAEVVGNSALTSERHTKVLTGFEYQPWDHLFLKSNFYQTSINGLIEYNRRDTLRAQSANRRDLQFLGSDLQLQWKFLSNFKFNMSLSTIDNAEIFDHPEVTLISYLQYRNCYFHGDLCPTFRIEGQYIGQRKSRVSSPFDYNPIDTTLGAVFLLNVHTILDLGHLKIFVLLENLLDQQYQLIYGYPMPGRTVHYGLQWEFWD